MEQAHFWQRVKQEIKAHKYSQKKLAEYIGVPTQTLWGWIHYNRIPDALTACSIAEALGVTVEYLVRGNDDINAEEKTQRTFTRKTAANRIQKFAQKIGEEAERLRL
jgi:transcriptional regulator with XRE-family HTH domain